MRRHKKLDVLKLLWSFATNQESEIAPGGFYRKKTLKGRHLRDEFLAFSEGVTELIAEEVFTEYLKRTGASTELKGSKSAPEYIEGYLGMRPIVRAFIASVAERTGVPYEVVWGSIKQGYFVGEDLGQNELIETFGEIGLDAAAQAVRHVTSNADASRVLDLMNIPANSFPEEVANRLRASLLSYQAAIKDTDPVHAEKMGKLADAA